MKYVLFQIKTDNSISVIENGESADVELSRLRELVGGHIDIVTPSALRDVDPFAVMVIDDEGKMKYKEHNSLATVLYGNPFDFVVGDVVIGTRFNVDPFAVPDVYAIDQVRSERIKREIELIKDWCI